MKIIKEKEDNPLVAVTFRLPKLLLEKVTQLATDNDISRQKLVTAILEQAITDKKLALKIRN